MKENECYLCEVDISSASYFKRVTINKEHLIIEVCPECYLKFKWGTDEEKQEYILKKRLNLKGIYL